MHVTAAQAVHIPRVFKRDICQVYIKAKNPLIGTRTRYERLESVRGECAI